MEALPLEASQKEVNAIQNPEEQEHEAEMRSKHSENRLGIPPKPSTENIAQLTLKHGNGKRGVMYISTTTIIPYVRFLT